MLLDGGVLVRTIGQNSWTWQLEIGTHPYLQMFGRLTVTHSCPELGVRLLFRLPVTAPLRAPGSVATQSSIGYPGPALLRRRRPSTQRRRWVRARRAVVQGLADNSPDPFRGVRPIAAPSGNGCPAGRAGTQP